MNADSFIDCLREAELIGRTGRVTRILPTFVEADGPSAPLGALCRIETSANGEGVLAEVVGVNAGSVVLAFSLPVFWTGYSLVLLFGITWWATGIFS